MIMQRTAFTKRQAAGFTLLELLLSVGLLGLLLAGIYGILNGWTERAIDRQAASDMLRVRTAAHDYVLAKFDNLKTTLPLNQFAEINVDDLKPDNYLPNGYIAMNAFRQKIRIFARKLQVNKINPDGSAAMDSNVPPAPIMLTTFEVVVVSDNSDSGETRVNNKRLIDTVTAGGPSMGVYADMVMPGMTFTGLVTSLHGQWDVTLGSLGVAGYNPSPSPDADAGGFIATYDLVSSESSEANDHWLYRVPIDNRPELNRMITDLNMNANEVQNVGTVIADKYNVEGNAAFRGQAQGAAADTAQGMTVEQALRVDTPNDVRFNMKPGNAGCTFTAAADGGNRALTGSGCALSGGEFQTIGETGEGHINVVDSVTADGNVITDSTHVNNTTDVKGISTFELINGTSMTTRATALAPTTEVTGPKVLAQEFQTGAMTAHSGATVNTQLVAARIATGQAYQYQTPQMTVGNAIQIDGKLGANQIRATNTLYLNNALTPGTYHDPSMNNRQVDCLAWSNGKTYCEPRGNTVYPGGQYVDSCWDNGSGYTCNYWRRLELDGSYQPYGQCIFTRSIGNSGQAYERENCT